MNALFHKLTRPGTRRTILRAGLLLTTLIILLYQFENWRGARAWDDARTRLLETREHDNLKDLTPPELDRDSNFFETPALKDLALQEGENATQGPTGLKRQRLHHSPRGQTQVGSFPIHDPSPPARCR